MITRDGRPDFRTEAAALHRADHYANHLLKLPVEHRFDEPSRRNNRDRGALLSGPAKRLEPVPSADLAKHCLPDTVTHRHPNLDVWLTLSPLPDLREPRLASGSLNPEVISSPVTLVRSPRIRPSFLSCSIMDEEGRDRPATPAERVEPERAAVWEPHHVEERFLDHFAGRPNVAVEYFKVKLPTDADEQGGKGRKG